jgi:hypothetical protein
MRCLPSTTTKTPTMTTKMMKRTMLPHFPCPLTLSPTIPNQTTQMATPTTATTPIYLPPTSPVTAAHSKN